MGDNKSDGVAAMKMQSLLRVAVYNFLIGSTLLCSGLTPKVDVTKLGAKADGTSAAITTAAFRYAFQVAASGMIVVPDGTYLLDNSAGPVIVRDFSGELRFSKMARLQFTASNRGGLWFVGGRKAAIYGLHAGYLSPPSVRAMAEEAIKFDGTIDTLLTDVNIENSPAAGVLFYDSIRPRVVNAVIRNTRADGLHFANCQDAEAINLDTADTGDDGLAFVNYLSGPERSGGMAKKIAIKNSSARGIAVVGQSLVRISDFVIENTSSSGVLCGEDSFWKTRVPTGVQFSSGQIISPGRQEPTVGNTFGIEVHLGGCAFSDIEITGAAARGVSAFAPDQSLSIAQVRVKGNLRGDGFNIQVKQANVSDAEAANSPGYGFYFGDCLSVFASHLSTVDVSTNSSLHRAVWFENVQEIKATGLKIQDIQASPTGYVLGTYSSAQKSAGYIHEVSATIPSGRLLLENNSPGVLVSDVH